MSERRATDLSPIVRRITISLALLVLFIPGVMQAQAIIKVNDNVNVKFGTLIQTWADEAQDPITKGYAQNLFLRRMRFLVGGQLAPNITFFFETDNPNLGKAPKSLGTGFITQDAFIEWKPTNSNSLAIAAGLILPPLCRNCLESAATLLSLDYGAFSFTESAATQSSVGRDTGVQARGYANNGHFEWRAGVFQGFRAAGSRNPMRVTGRVFYNFLDPEVGFFYPGMYFGNKRVFGLGAGADHQMDYNANSVDAFLSLPTAAKNAFNAEATFLKFDGGTTFTTVPEQTDVTAQAGFYLAGPKVMPFVRYEKQDFKTAANNPKDNSRYQAGLTWYPNGHNFNIKGAYSHVSPRVGNKTDQFTVQMQFFYY